MLSDIEKIYRILLDKNYQEKLFGDLKGLEKKGSGYIAHCPFHNDVMPTLVVYGDRPEYFCFACSARGDWLQYMQLKSGMSFYDALSQLSSDSVLEGKNYNKTMWDNDLSRSLILECALGFFNAQLFSSTGEEGLHYLYHRGYSMSEVEGSFLGYYPGFSTLKEYLVSQGFSQEMLDEVLDTVWNENAELCRLVIPYRDSAGRLMGLYGRNIDVIGEDAYMPLTDISPLKDVPFLMYRSRAAQKLIVVEGLFDALLIDQIAIKPVVSIGKSGLSKGQMDTLSACGTQHVILCLGSSERQRKATDEASDLIRSKGIGVSVLPLDNKYSDLDEFIRSTSLSDFKRLLKKDKTP
jgi:DNA primase